MSFGAVPPGDRQTPHSDVRRAFKLRRVCLAVGAFAGCTLLAASAHVLMGSWGRDVRATSAFLALLLAVAIASLVGWRRYRVIEALVALVVVEVLFAAAIGWFGYGGLARADGFFYSWFVSGNLFIAAPWLVGTALGAWLSRRRAPLRRPD